MFNVISILPDGVRILVRSGETVLEAINRYGFDFTVGCREGGCGACRVALVSGNVSYLKTVAQSVLSDFDRQHGWCLPCRAVPTEDIVIRLNPSDRLRRGPFSDMLVKRDLDKAGLTEKAAQTEHESLKIFSAVDDIKHKTTGDKAMTNMPNETKEHRPLHDHEWEGNLRVEKKEIQADGVVVLTLVDPDGAELPEWAPGAHIDLNLSDSLTRQYSLCGDFRQRKTYQIGVLRDPASRGGSQYVHEQIHAGGLIQVRGPRNHFPLNSAPEYIFIAGGIGITPILPMILAAQLAGANWRLLYGGRSKSSMGFLNELAQFGDHVSLFPEDEVGRIPLSSVLSEARDDIQIYVCGPEPLIAAVEKATAHWTCGSLHTERFAAKLVEAPANALESFEVVCQKSGLTLQIGPDQSILDAVEKAGVKVLASCRAGVCGTCEVDIIEGKADHRDSVLSCSERASNEFMLVCCSRSLTPKIVLNI